MLKSHEKFHSSNGKRLLLIADDEIINREILKEQLKDAYEIIEAADGQEALDQMHEYKETLSLVLLDLMMPKKTGYEVLESIKQDPSIQRIPVIVLTSDQGAEVRTLHIGATDFIMKPYPGKEVIKARIQRTIELSEDREIINVTERDPLTGLYNKEYFYSYAGQYDVYHKDAKLDAIVMDINHFHMINERFGTAFGDAVLRRIGQRIREMVSDKDGIVCRREADTFMVYCRHGKDYQAILENATISLSKDGERENNRVRLRMGVYENVDMSMEIERRFDRAKMACDKVKDNYTDSIGFFDEALHRDEMYEEQLIDSFASGISNEEFKVFYQPKFNILDDTPVLASAEALVRWQHPELGMISPGVFIPLFERNGLIQKLDRYVWRRAAGQIGQWKKQHGISVPVSVNVSRIDMYDPNLIVRLTAILEENGLTTDDFLLEITESAYTQDSEQIVKTVNDLRSKGFRIEMDDFGTGYSSLSMISTLPIDALKVDMQFIRDAFREGGNTRMLEFIIGIAEHLQVPVVAEGVETKEQLDALRALGCEIVQGYYFSRPVPPEEYEKFIVERKQMGDVDANLIKKSTALRSRTFGSIAQALSQDYFCIYYVNSRTERFVEYSADEVYENLGIEKSGDDFFEMVRKIVPKTIYEEDQKPFLQMFTKEHVLDELKTNRAFTLTYRMMLNERPTYVHLKATRMEDEHDPHFVIGLSNVDEQIRREQEHRRAMHMASRDPLTGVKNKLAYAEAEAKINTEITDGICDPFAIAICDINGLKEINDSLGHTAGDQYIRDACGIICRIFSHSPVFRIGGDEFCVILRGGDYEVREDLLAQMRQVNQANAAEDKVTIAGGISEYAPESDYSVTDVFDRADGLMYRNKKQFKRA